MKTNVEAADFLIFRRPLQNSRNVFFFSKIDRSPSEKDA